MFGSGSPAYTRLQSSLSNVSSGHSRGRLLLILAAALLILIPLVSHKWLTTGEVIKFGGKSATDPSIADIIAQLWTPLKLPITSNEFVDPDGETFKLPTSPTWDGHFGRRLCILDVDTRPIDGEGDVLQKEPLMYSKLRGLSAGMLAHYNYALIHGYDYRLIQSPKYPDRADAWAKVLMMRETLRDYDMVVFFDSDAVLTHPEVPIEWLLNYWNVGHDKAIALSSEPALDRDKDDRGNPAENTGFMILRNLPVIWDLFKAWAECPEETRYQGCSKWVETRQREQAAFSNYIRYDQAFQNSIQILPCEEANGSPEFFEETKCRGVFLTHHWLDKDSTKNTFTAGIMQAYTRQLHKLLKHEKSGVVQDLRTKTLKGSDVLDPKV